METDEEKEHYKRFLACFARDEPDAALTAGDRPTDHIVSKLEGVEVKGDDAAHKDGSRPTKVPVHPSKLGDAGTHFSQGAEGAGCPSQDANGSEEVPSAGRGPKGAAYSVAGAIGSGEEPSVGRDPGSVNFKGTTEGPLWQQVLLKGSTNQGSWRWKVKFAPSWAS